MAWFGADVLKVERMHTGDNTRIQLRDIPNADALYFTMVNSNKRSLEIDTKMPEGKAILEDLIRRADVMIENMAPGALDPLVKELLYIAVSVTNNCEYCIHSHTAGARAKGMSPAMFDELLAVVALANATNRLANGYRIDVDPQFRDPLA